MPVLFIFATFQTDVERKAVTLDCARDTGGVHLSRYRKRGHNRTPSRDADLFVRDEKFDFHFCVQVADPISREGRPPCSSVIPNFLSFQHLSLPDRFLLPGSSHLLLSVCLCAAAGGEARGAAKEERELEGKGEGRGREGVLLGWALGSDFCVGWFLCSPFLHVFVYIRRYYCCCISMFVNFCDQ